MGQTGAGASARSVWRALCPGDPPALATSRPGGYTYVLTACMHRHEHTPPRAALTQASPSHHVALPLRPSGQSPPPTPTCLLTYLGPELLGGARQGLLGPQCPAAPPGRAACSPRLLGWRQAEGGQWPQAWVRPPGASPPAPHPQPQVRISRGAGLAPISSHRSAEGGSPGGCGPQGCTGPERAGPRLQGPSGGTLPLPPARSVRPLFSATARPGERPLPGHPWLAAGRALGRALAVN